MGVEVPQYSEKKIKMYEAAKRYFEALNSGKSKEDVEQLRLKMAALEAEYSDNPAYLALMRQELIKKEVEVDTDATGQ